MIVNAELVRLGHYPPSPLVDYFSYAGEVRRLLVPGDHPPFTSRRDACRWLREQAASISGSYFLALKSPETPQYPPPIPKRRVVPGRPKSADVLRLDAAARQSSASAWTEYERQCAEAGIRPVERR